MNYNVFRDKLSYGRNMSSFFRDKLRHRPNIWISLIFHDVSLKNYNNLARAARKFFWTYTLVALICHDFSLEILCVDKIRIPPRGILCVETIRSPPRGILCVDKIGSVPQDRRQPRRQNFFPADFGGPADCPALHHIGTLARLIIKYPACQLLGIIP